MTPFHDEETTSGKPIHHKRNFWIAILIIVLTLFLFYRYHNVRTTEKDNAVQVTVMPATIANVPVYLSGLGTVTPTYSVLVKSQVNGRLLNIYFKEGQMVKAGNLLAEIDPAPYQAQLLQYQGQLARDQALLANSKVDLKRYQVLWKQDSVANQTLYTQQALVKQYEAAIKTDEGQVQAVEVNLNYTRIVSPIDGRVGLRLVDPGNYIQTSDASGIAVVNMLNPITVIFTLPEDDIPKVAKQVYAGKTLTVFAYDRNQKTLLATGKLITIDNQIDPATGTVKLKAQFDNTDNNLFPNQFVNIQLLVATLQNTIIIPTAAIQYNAKGPFVYLLMSNQTVALQPIVTGPAINNETSVMSGLKAGQKVVTEGADKLIAGTKVKVINETPAKQARKQ